VDGDPEAELARRKAVATLERDHVRADVIDEIARVIGVLGEQQVVLAKDTGGHPPEHDTELRPGGGPHGGGHGRRQLRAQEPLARRLGQDRPEEAPEGVDVGPDPAIAVGDLGAAGPARDGRPVDASTSDSATGVSWAKSSTIRRWVRASTTGVVRRATRDAKRSATFQSTGSGGPAVSFTVSS